MSASTNSADRVFTAEDSSRVQFSDLTERQAVKLGAMVRYVSGAHFQTWQQLRRMPDFDTLQGIFTPLVCLEVEVTDIKVQPGEMLTARGRSVFGKVLGPDGAIRQITRDGVYQLVREDGARVGEVRFVNVFTRYHADPAQRRILEIPSELGIQGVPTEITEFPGVQDLVAMHRPPDFLPSEPNAWYYAQTDPNRHVNSLAYLQVLQDYVATQLHQRGEPLARLWANRVRVVFRKPCFRGEPYRRFAWETGDDPRRIGAAICKESDPPGHLPAAAVEFRLALHEDS